MENHNPFFSDLPEIDLAARLQRSKRTRMGQFFTPFVIAKDMARWIIAGRKPANILDPALGLGIFFRAAVDNTIDPPPKFIGFELDTEIAAQAVKLFRDNGYRDILIHQSNYLTSSWTPRYDGILCNPPYRRFRGLPDKDELTHLVQTNTGLKISRAANLYIYFLIKAVHQMAEGARAAIILPYEFLNADYGQPVKQYLLDEGVLRKILILGKAIDPFEQVITTSCILCLERTPPVHPPQMILCRTLEELAAAVDAPVEGFPATAPGFEIQPPSRKWLVSTTHHPSGVSPRLVPLSTFGRVKRGIATGDNRYFLLSESRRRDLGLEESCLLPCLSKAGQAPGYYFSSTNFDHLVRTDRPVWLFQASGQEENPAVQGYLTVGIEQGSDRRYLTRSRTPWYALEERPPAPLLATTFSRSGIRWIRNDADVRFLTAFHGFYPFPETDIEVLSAYLITPLAQRILAQNRREYGNGLHKFEPNDLNHGLVADITLMPASIRRIVLHLYIDLIFAHQERLDTGQILIKLDEAFSTFLE